MNLHHSRAPYTRNMRLAFWLALIWAREETVSPGVVYRMAEIHEGGPWQVHVLEFDPRTPGVDLVAVRANDSLAGRETVSSMAARLGAIAAVNAGYFVVAGPYAGAPVSAYQLGGKLLTGSAAPVGTGVPGAPLSGDAERTALVICQTAGEADQIEMEKVRFTGQLTAADGAATRIDGLNRPLSGDDLVVFTTSLGRNSRASSQGVEAVLDRASIVIRLEQGFGNVEIPEGGTVLSAQGAAADWIRAHLRLGDAVRAAYGIEREPKGCAAKDLVAAGPLLIRQGVISTASEGFRHEKARNPRTAIAVTAKGTILLLVVDGRQAKSVGMTVEELARFLLSLGAVEAMNLDGGGSSAMVVNGRLMNSPSDGKERPVSDALMIRKRPAGDPGVK